MFLSHLKLRPDWKKHLQGTYHLHCRLCMAFPTHARIQRDPEFIESYLPQDFLYGKAHIPRTENDNFLFREDRGSVIVQSGTRPDFNYAFSNAKYLLDNQPVVKEINYKNPTGSSFSFNIRANPTDKVVIHRYPKDKTRYEAITDPDKQEQWIRDKAAESGFSIEANLSVNAEGVIRQQRSKREENGVFIHYSVVYSGIGKVVDEKLFSEARIKGIGRAKAFGFGLMLVKNI